MGAPARLEQVAAVAPVMRKSKTMTRGRSGWVGSVMCRGFSSGWLAANPSMRGRHAARISARSTPRWPTDLKPPPPEFAAVETRKNGEREGGGVQVRQTRYPALIPGPNQCSYAALHTPEIRPCVHHLEYAPRFFFATAECSPRTIPRSRERWHYRNTRNVPDTLCEHTGHTPVRPMIICAQPSQANTWPQGTNA